MNLNKQFSAVDDEILGNVSGGFLQVSKWRDYVSSQIIPALNGLMSNASSADQSVIRIACTTLQSTMILNADVAEPVRMLWSNYNTIYRSQLQSDTVRATMDNMLYSAKLYIDQNA